MKTVICIEEEQIIYKGSQIAVMQSTIFFPFAPVGRTQKGNNLICLQEQPARLFLILASLVSVFKEKCSFKAHGTPEQKINIGMHNAGHRSGTSSEILKNKLVLDHKGEVVNKMGWKKRLFGSMLSLGRIICPYPTLMHESVMHRQCFYLLAGFAELVSQDVIISCNMLNIFQQSIL